MFSAVEENSPNTITMAMGARLREVFRGSLMLCLCCVPPMFTSVFCVSLRAELQTFSTCH
jgi:hypothetical protein